MRAPLIFCLLLATPAFAQGPSPVVLEKSERWIGDRGEVVTARKARNQVIQMRSGDGWKTFYSRNSEGAVVTIDGVPPGPFVVRDSHDVVLSTARHLDLGMTHLGRPDLQLIPDSINRGRVPLFTSLAVDLAGLAPWQTGDRVVFFVPNARSYESNVQNKLNAALAPGATRLAASGNYLSFRGAYAVDGPGHGDEAWFLDMASAVSPEGVRYLATRKLLRTTKLKIEANKQAVVSGKMTDVHQTQKTVMQWQVADPAALARAVSPEAKATGGVWQLIALPGGDRYGGHDFGGTLVYAPFETPQPPPRARLTFGDPFPKSWGRVGLARLNYRVAVPVLGARDPYSLEVTIAVADTAAALGAGPVKPLLTPVREPKINGRDAFTPQAHVTLNPEVSWTPPATGQPTIYELHVYRTRMNRERKADLQLVTTIHTADTRVPFPPNILVPAEVYVLVIEAHQAEGLDPQHPFHEPLRKASASCVTALFSP